MEIVKLIADRINDLIWNTPSKLPVLVFLLLGVGIFLTVRMRFIQVRRLRHALDVIRGKYDDPADAGDINHFQALSAALSATVGIGNIAGVATAIHYGGPGALFWMWLTAFVGMASKFVECTLGVHYRRINPDGSVSGGPMYSIERGLGPRFKPLAIMFAVCAVISSFGSGNGVQAFTVADSFRSDFGVPPFITGLVSATLVGLVIIGGIKRIGAVASRIVPFMCALYVIAGLIVLFLNYERIPAAFAVIFSEAFTPRGGVGGFAGSTFTLTLIWGVKRGLFSNEAGQGSAPIAHAAARTSEPVREGLVAMTGPFIDTLIICTITGLSIITTGTWLDKHDDRVALNPGGGVRFISADGEATDPYFGELRIEGGKIPDRARAVRNRSVVDDAALSLGQAPFSGLITTDEDGRPREAQTDEGLVPIGSILLHGEMALNGSPLTAAAFKRGLAPLVPWGNLIVTFGVALFALSTAIAWSYYGDRSIEYLLGARAILPYRMMFTVVHFFGAVFSLEVVWAYADAALGLMALPNLLSMLLLSGVVVRLSRDYMRRSNGV